MISSRLGIPALAAIVAAGAAVRLLACRGDLWLDEVWTLALLDRVHSPLGILTEMRHANNHVLNTLFAYAVGPLEHDTLYRAPAWLGGVLAIALGARLAWLGDGPIRSDRRPAADASAGTRAVWAAAVLAGSYLLVLYGSEARGYSLSLAFLLAALAVAIRDDVRAVDAQVRDTATGEQVALTLPKQSYAVPVMWLDDTTLQVVVFGPESAMWTCVIPDGFCSVVSMLSPDEIEGSALVLPNGTSVTN